MKLTPVDFHPQLYQIIPLSHQPKMCYYNFKRNSVNGYVLDLLLNNYKFEFFIRTNKDLNDY
jgi:hypothetical protein